MNAGRIGIPFGLLGTGLLATALGWWANVPQAAPPPDLATQMGNMGALAVMIERAVEVYLGLTSRNGPDRSAPVAEVAPPPATRTAATAALALGLLTAAAGVRILPSLGLAPSAALPPALNLLRGGIDILLSGALMGGGSMLVHEAAEAMRTGMRRIG